MKNIQFMKSQMKIMLAAAMGLLCILAVNGFFYQQNIYNSVQSVTDLTVTAIKSELEKDCYTTTGTSVNMASDYKLNQFLYKCQAGVTTQRDLEDMKKCLNNYKENGNYSTVFLVDSKDKSYYSRQGLDRTLEQGNPEDEWYFTFMDTDEEFSFDVDNDQANNDIITVFVDYKMYDEAGEVTGVTGAGFVIDNVQAMIQEYEEQYDVKVYIVDGDGNLQISREESDLSAEQEQAYEKIDPKQYTSFTYTEHNRFVQNQGNYYMVVRKLNNADWYLIVSKTKEGLRHQILFQILIQAFAGIAILIVYLVVVNKLVKQHNTEIIKIMNTDDLTNLPNRRAFEQFFQTWVKEEHTGEGVLFLFDIDNFKGINDSKGHLGGDDILSFVAYVCRKYINEDNGMVARWGGDEFVGMIHAELDTAVSLLSRMQQDIQHAIEEGEMPITISIGVTPLRDAYLNDMLSEVDDALYQAKKNGKNQLVIWKAESPHH